jgi:nicotinate-nucleotide pyrophosphorylase (carboxylating)
MVTFQEQVKNNLKLALAEDLSGGDITTDSLISQELLGKASFLIKADGFLAGMDIARQVFLEVDPATRMRIMVRDGRSVKKGDIVAAVSGKLASILKAERTALNFLQRLSGIATATALYVDAVKGLPVKILDTRKTTPGLRLLEKYAVRMGGGQNHRLGLSDSILIKDNHLEALRKQGLNIQDAVFRARRQHPEAKVEVETKTLEEAELAAAAGADWIMLDNMELRTMKKAVKIISGRAKIEASGNITLDNVRSVAETGVDFISVGANTHSVKALDISLEFE